MDHDSHMGHHAHMDHTAAQASDSAHGHEYHVIHEQTTQNANHAGHSGHVDHSTHHQAFFNTDFHVYVLFETWLLDSRSNIFLACLLTCLLAVGYQGTKWFRQYLHSNYRDRRHTIRSREHLLQTFLYGSEFLVSYVLMLVVMTYNLWVFITTILGIGIGYFLFGWHRYLRNAACPEMCLNVSEQSRDYDVNPSAQELMPLESEKACAGCSYENAFENDKETDILT